MDRNEVVKLTDERVSSTIKKYSIIFGATNIVFVLSAFSYIFFVLPDIAFEKAMTKLYGNVSVYEKKLEDKILEAHEKTGILKEKMRYLDGAIKDVSEKEVELESLFSRVSAQLEDIQSHSSFDIAQAITALNSSKDAKAILTEQLRLKNEIQTFSSKFIELEKDYSNTKIQLNSVSMKIGSVNDELRNKVSYNSDIEIYNAKYPKFNMDMFSPGGKAPSNRTNVQLYEDLSNPAQTWRIRK